MRELYRHWPRLADTLPCEALATLPTPVVALPRIHRSRAWMKCDNLSHPVYGGNKLRKLEFIIPALKQKQIREVVTLGGTGTNSGVAVAMVCRDLGIRCRIYTFEQASSPAVEKNQRLLQTFGAEQVRVGTSVMAGLRYYLDWRRLDPSRYFLYAGCSNTASVFGFANALLELKQQVDDGVCPAPGHIVVATGSCSTLAGLLLGSALIDWPVRITGVRVAPDFVGPVPGCTPELVSAFMRKALALMAREYPELRALPLPTPVMTGAYYGAGYGLPTAASARALAFARDRAGITLETTYTAKAFAAFLDAVRKDREPVLFWNTHHSSSGNSP